MRLVGTPTVQPETWGDPALQGKTLGIVNGSSWVDLWSMYFGRKYLPGVKLVSVGNEAVQLNFMGAHERGEPVPPQINIDLFASYAKDLAELYPIDAILVTCSTMNRAFGSVREAMEPYNIPVVQIDEPMMEAAVTIGGRTLVIATHGPTVNNTQALLRETAERMGKEIEFEGATIEEAFHTLGEGRIKEHNEAIAETIREVQSHLPIQSVVLAQLSMAVFLLSYPDPVATFGIPVLTSAEYGFKRIREVLC